jgi:hypothetical protein
VPLMFRITVNQKRLDVSTRIFIHPPEWDHLRARVRGKSPLVIEWNRRSSVREGNNATVSAHHSDGI